MNKVIGIVLLSVSCLWIGYLLGTSNVKKEALDKGFAEYEPISGEYQWKPLVFFTNYQLVTTDTKKRD